jgi:NDP-sugar pyrophosphorylase family protein
VTADLPKPLVPIANRPLISHQLAHLAGFGVQDVVLALGYNADQFGDVEREAKDLGLRLQLITEPEPLGTGGALRYCYDQGAFDERPLLWMNGDVVAAPDIDELAATHADRGGILTFWLTSARRVSEFGVLELDSDGRVRRFLEKPAPEETDSHLVNAGILMLEPDLLERIPAGTFFSFESGLLPDLVRDREPLFGLFDGSYWLDTGRPSTYLGANRHVMEGRVDWEPAGQRTEEGLWEGTGVQREPVDVIHPAVLGDGVVLEEHAQLFGRTVLGDRVHVRTRAELENCVVFDDVEIGENTEVINSIVCAGARIGDNVVLHGSIVGAGAEVGARNELRETRLWSGFKVPDGVLVVDRSS